MTTLKVYEYSKICVKSSSMGTQEKWVEDNLFVKADRLGYESVSEALISDLEEYIEDFPHVNYYMCKIEELCSNGGDINMMGVILGYIIAIIVPSRCIGYCRKVVCYLNIIG